MNYTQYTREEIKILMGILGPLPHVDVRHIARACSKAIKAPREDTAQTLFNDCLYSIAVSKDQHWVLFHTDLEDIPLRINDNDPIIALIARWRLIIAK
jgi:hypothetical protein